MYKRNFSDRYLTKKEFQKHFGCSFFTFELYFKIEEYNTIKNQHPFVHKGTGIEEFRFLLFFNTPSSHAKQWSFQLVDHF